MMTGELSVKRSTFSANTATSRGGGAVVWPFGGTGVLENSTFSGNMAEGGGDDGALMIDDTETEVLMYNCTVALNESTDEGWGIFVEDASLELLCCRRW